MNNNNNNNNNITINHHEDNLNNTYSYIEKDLNNDIKRIESWLKQLTIKNYKVNLNKSVLLEFSNGYINHKIIYKSHNNL